MRQTRKIYDSRWQAKNPNYLREYYLKNKEKLAAKARLRYLNGRKSFLDKASARYHSMSPEQREEHNRKRRERHARQPHVRRTEGRLREANERGTFAKLTKSNWEGVLERYHHMCLYCSSKENLTIEHLTPLSRGGDNFLPNIAPACLSCNSSKRDKTYEEFLNWKFKRHWAMHRVTVYNIPEEEDERSRHTTAVKTEHSRA